MNYDDYLTSWMAPEPEMCECPDCHGTGMYYSKYDLIDHREIEISEEEYNEMPDYDENISNEDYIASGIRYIKNEAMKCGLCDGAGEVDEWTLERERPMAAPNDYEDYCEGLASEHDEYVRENRMLMRLL